MKQFLLTCESTVDMLCHVLAKRGIPVLCYSYTIDGELRVDDMQKSAKTLPEFYQKIADGKLPSTSQLNPFAYEDFFESLIEKGDILHIAFSSGLSGSVENAKTAAKTVMERHEGRRIEVIDSLCGSSGYGLLVDSAADLWDKKHSLDEVAAWVMENRQRVHHQFYSTRLDFFKKSGRLSGPTSTIATLLGICPIMRVDDKGKIIAYDKVRGKKNALSATVKEMTAHAEKGTDYDGKCFISHSNCPDEAERLRDAIAAEFKHLKKKNICIFDIGPIIASHCGPGTVALYFFGEERAPLSSK